MRSATTAPVILLSRALTVDDLVTASPNSNKSPHRTAHNVTHAAEARATRRRVSAGVAGLANATSALASAWGLLLSLSELARHSRRYLSPPHTSLRAISVGPVGHHALAGGYRQQRRSLSLLRHPF